jgi:hypothetical protein
MGNASSLSGGSGGAGTEGRAGLGGRAALRESPKSPAAVSAALARTGRYAAVTMPSGGTVHLLGVLPCSTRSEEEAHALVTAVRPTALYVDLAPEWAGALREEVEAGRVGDWAIPDSSPSFRLYPGAGLTGSILIRNALADNDMLGLMGAEWYGAYKAGIASARGVGAGRGGGGSGAAGVPPAALLAFPYSMHHRNGETLERPSAFVAMIIGNSSFGSTAVTALVGGQAGIFAGETVAVDHMVAIPDGTGYFTRHQVRGERGRHAGGGGGGGRRMAAGVGMCVTPIPPRTYSPTLIKHRLRRRHTRAHTPSPLLTRR